MDKHPLLVFSGGMDSSYMLWQHLEQGDVYTCYIKATQAPNKIPAELAARKKIIEFFENKTGNKVISDTVVDLGNCFEATEQSYASTHRWNNNIPDHAFSQALVWPFGLQFAADGNKHSKVCLGYVMGDQFALHLGDMALAWQHTSNFARRTPVPMEFPLMYTSKDRILREIPLEIIPDLWICELPKVLSTGKTIACDDCPACETWAKTVFIWERRNERKLDDAIKERIASMNSTKMHSEVTDAERKDSNEAIGSSTQSSGECGLKEIQPDPSLQAGPKSDEHAEVL